MTAERACDLELLAEAVARYLRATERSRDSAVQHGSKSLAFRGGVDQMHAAYRELKEISARLEAQSCRSDNV